MLNPLEDTRFPKMHSLVRKVTSSVTSASPLDSIFCDDLGFGFYFWAHQWWNVRSAPSELGAAGIFVSEMVLARVLPAHHIAHPAQPLASGPLWPAGSQGSWCWRGLGFVLELGFRERALGLALVGTRTYRAVELAPCPSPAVSLCRPRWLRKALKSCFTCIVVHPLWDLPQQKAQGWFHAAPWWCQLGFAVSAWLLTSAVTLLMESSA